MELPFQIAWAFFSSWAIVRLLLDKREPASTIAWLFFVTTVPLIGALGYFVFGPQQIIRQATKRKVEIRNRIAPPAFLIDLVKGDQDPTNDLPESEAHILRLAKELSDYEATHGNRVTLLLKPDETLAEMQRAIDNAKSFVHLEYYIISSDEVTEQLFDSLIAARKRGVEVRILYDSLGSLSLKKFAFRKLADNGVEIAGFLPLSAALQRVNLNFRNHRKILIVDGQVAFTGGANIGKEYLGKISPHQWRDYNVRIEGPVCLQLQDVFAKDWQFTTEEDLFQPKYYPAPFRVGESRIQVLESGPDSPFFSLHQAVFSMLNSAKEEILLMTPYFIPDVAIFTSLLVARLRGVRVKLLLPAKSDAYLVRHAARSFYEDLLKAGIEIYEYQPRILHAKLLTIDDRWAVLGSANMDVRSFRLNFELNLLIHGAEFSESARRLFVGELKQSERIELEEFRNRSVVRKLQENACRLMSPIL